MGDIQIIDLITKIVQLGAGGMLMAAGYAFLKFLSAERADRREEREGWFSRLDALTESITEALNELRKSVTLRCPIQSALGDDSMPLFKRLFEVERSIQTQDWFEKK